MKGKIDHQYWEMNENKRARTRDAKLGMLLTADETGSHRCVVKSLLCGGKSCSPATA